MPNGSSMNAKQELVLVIPEKVKQEKKKAIFKDTFLDFKLWGKCDTRVSPQLINSLKSYSGPKVKITSLRRHWGTKSRHECGKAVDMEFSHALIE